MSQNKIGKSTHILFFVGRLSFITYSARNVFVVGANIYPGFHNQVSKA